MNFPGTSWYAVTAPGSQVIRDQKKTGNHWYHCHEYPGHLNSSSTQIDVFAVVKGLAWRCTARPEVKYVNLCTLAPRVLTAFFISAALNRNRTATVLFPFSRSTF